MNFKRLANKIRKSLDIIKLKGNISYSQSGEDLIIKYLFDSIGKKNPSYIDIGANDPVKGNNTYLFYQNGSKGICVEPDISLINDLNKKRSDDLVLNIGISSIKADFATFYYFDNHYSAWNTFSKSDAEIKSEQSGIKYKKSKIELNTLNNICDKYNFNEVDFLSVDVEGLDLEILKSIDFVKVSPDVICVETICFSLKNTIKKNDDITSFMLSKEYIVYADTNLNTIFCKKDLFLQK
jgi:FkbM family methyltransferase